jgi:hypothetical protein
MRIITASDRIYRLGDTGATVRLIQEWLCFHRIQVNIDSNFGAATESAVKMFQGLNNLAVDGMVGALTYAALIQPLTQALRPIAAQGRSLGELTVAYALQHNEVNPREVGGKNCGPWVRLYMQGNEGIIWPWCAGFVSFILNEAAQTLQIALPFSTSFSCDQLALNAKAKKVFIIGDANLNYSVIKPGSLFLLRGKQAMDWIHTGIVVKAEPTILQTVEGNTNRDGSLEGVEVWRNIRNYHNMDFILV